MMLYPFRSLALALSVLGLLAACDKDPASAVKIASVPTAPAAGASVPAAGGGTAALSAPLVPSAPSSAALPASSPQASAAPPGGQTATVADVAGASEWRPAGCPPPAEGAQGQSRLVVSGPCAFRHQGAFNCERIHDDFYISMSRKAANGSTLMVFINVEKFNGPGDYKNAEMYLSVQDRSSIYRWSSQDVALTIGPGEAFAMLPTTRLEAEPVLVGCTGPMTNYQCSGRGELEALLGTAEVLSGKMHCEGGAKAP